MLLAVLLANTIVVTTCVESPASRWDLPSCADYELDNALIENAQRNDRSAVQLLQERYATAFTVAEHLRIGGALLGRVSDDSALWKELSMHAENAVNFADDGEKVKAYCAEHDCNPRRYDSLAWYAYLDITSDPRSRPLLLRVLRSPENRAAWFAIEGLAEQHDETVLPEIEKVLERQPHLVTALAYFKSEAADRLAAKYLTDAWDREEYKRLRDDAEDSGR